MNNHSVCEVMVAVAVNESGRTDCCIIDNHYVQRKMAYQEWLFNKRSDSMLWSIKNIKVNVPMPVSFEDMREKEK